MKNWKKPAVPVLVVLVLGVALAVPALLSGDKVRDLVVEKIAEATGAEVTLGDATVRVLPRLAVHLEDGRIAGTGAALAAAQGRDVEVEDFTVDLALVEVRVALLPLLRRRIAVTSVKIDVPSLEVTTAEDRIIAEGAVLTVHDLQLGVPEATAPTADEPTPPGVLIPVDLSCRAELAVERLTVGGAAYDEVTAEAVLVERVIIVAPARALRGGGELAGEAVIDYARDPWGVLTFSFTAQGVPAAELLAPWAPDVGERLVADLEAEGAGTCRLRDGDTAQRTLSMTGALAAADGVLHAGNWLTDVRPYLGKRQDLVDIRFRRLDHVFKVEDGRYVVQELEIDGLDTRWLGSGSLGFDDTIDVSLAVLLPAGFTPDLGQWSFLADTLRDEEGRVHLDLRLTGRASAPNVGVDLSRLTAGTGKSAGEALQKGLGGLLDKWRDR